MNKTAKVYIAGHTGLVGSALVRELTRQGYANLILRTHAQLDLTCQPEVQDFFAQEKPDYVFLAAAKVGGIMANSTYPAEFIYKNLMITANVIHASYTYDAKKLLNLGSSCIYPKLASQPLKEEYLLTGALEPTNEAYALAKISAIKLCRYYNQQYGTNFMSVMPTNLYGPNDNFNLETSHVLPALIRKMHLGKCLQAGGWDALRSDLDKQPIEGVDGSAGEERIFAALAKYGIFRELADKEFRTTVTLWGTGSPRREFLYADDLANACIFLMQNYDAHEVGEFVNIGTGKDLTIKELAEVVAEVVGFGGFLKWDKSKPDGTPKKLLDVSRLEGLGWTRGQSLKKGIKRVYDWYNSLGELGVVL